MEFQNIRNEVQKSDDPYWNKVSVCFVDGLKRYVENKHLLPVPEKDILQEMYLALRTDDIKSVFGEIENGLFDDDLKQYRQWVMIATDRVRIEVASMTLVALNGEIFGNGDR